MNRAKIGVGGEDPIYGMEKQKKMDLGFVFSSLSLLAMIFSHMRIRESSPKPILEDPKKPPCLHMSEDMIDGEIPTMNPEIVLFP
jgi:hypothetical protein